MPSLCFSWWTPSSMFSLCLAKAGRCHIILFLYFFFLFLFPLSFLFSFIGRCHLGSPLLPYSSQWAPSSHSPSTLLQSTSISQRRASTGIWCPCFYIWWPGFCSCHPGDTPWLPGYEGQGNMCSWVPWDCKNWKDSSRQATTHRVLYRQQTETYTLSLSVKEVYLHVQELWPQGQASGLVHL